MSFSCSCFKSESEHNVMTMTPWEKMIVEQIIILCLSLSQSQVLTLNLIYFLCSPKRLREKVEVSFVLLYTMFDYGLVDFWLLFAFTSFLIEYSGPVVCSISSTLLLLMMIFFLPNMEILSLESKVLKFLWF